MKRLLKELYGSGILFFYFFKWPFVLFFPYLYLMGLDSNPILDLLWLYCVALIVKDLIRLVKTRKDKQKR
ncbi:MAG: hypothetical protein WCR69_04845 [Sulfuricurvum sp.]